MTIHSGRDRGSATILTLAAGLTTLLVAVAVGGVGAAIVARHRARIAADAAALAGAARAIDGAHFACLAAETVAAANGAKLVHCGLEGWDVVVTVHLRPGGPAGFVGVATASARAGPA